MASGATRSRWCRWTEARAWALGQASLDASEDAPRVFEQVENFREAVGWNDST
jgi:hypothetical protein